MSELAKAVTAAQSHQCVHDDGTWGHSGYRIQRGERYVRISVPPHSYASMLVADPLDRDRWNTYAECAECAESNGRGHLLARGVVGATTGVSSELDGPLHDPERSSNGGTNE